MLDLRGTHARCVETTGGGGGGCCCSGSLFVALEVAVGDVEDWGDTAVAPPPWPWLGLGLDMDDG